MQPTQQFVIPFNFWQGLLPAGDYPLSFDTNEDFVIVSTSGAAATASTSTEIYIEGSGGEIFFSHWLNASLAAHPLEEVLTPFIVIPEPSALNLHVGAGGAALSIDGYRIGPSAGGS
jgi:hypothetical protein